VSDPQRGNCDVFQCDECIAIVSMFDGQVEIALTFAVDEEGRAFDPATEDGDLAI
jgi:hypothetical protein